MKWYVKSAIDNVKGLLPAQDFLRRVKRRYVPYQTNLSRGSFAIDEGLLQIEWLRSRMSLPGATVMEIGTGWEPLVPILLHLAGAKTVLLTDATRLIDAATIEGSLECLRFKKATILEKLGLSAAAFDKALEMRQPIELDEFWGHFGFEYRAPCDCTKMNVESGSLDVVMSRAVFEHVPAPVIASMMTETKRMLKPGGLACHIIDNSDHWAHGDKTISRVNFLRYSDEVFRLTHLNELNYQNRLRHSEYAEMFREAGFAIVREHRDIEPGALAALDSMEVDARFRGRSRDDLATMNSVFLLEASSS